MPSANIIYEHISKKEIDLAMNPVLKEEGYSITNYHFVGDINYPTNTILSIKTNNNEKLSKVLERIAKEGRKYGVSCMIVSQRPAEISETITAQCNNFIAMRLLNPNDQNYVRKLVPDSLANLIDILPTLQQGEAFVIGDAVAIPTRVLFDMPSPTPASGDIKFFNKWQKKEADTNVADVVNNWWKQLRT